MARTLVLASTSPYRQALLQRLMLAFETCTPAVDEQRLPGELPATMVRRLSLAKAEAVASRYADALIIGSDQIATTDDGQILGKPGDHATACRQLQQVSGKSLHFLTGLCLLDTANGNTQVELVPFTVRFRPLTERQIDRYLQLEKPYNCAGSFKSEGMGIALAESLTGPDPTALIGLPLIGLTTLLANVGINVF